MALVDSTEEQRLGIPRKHIRVAKKPEYFDAVFRGSFKGVNSRNRVSMKGSIMSYHPVTRGYSVEQQDTAQGCILQSLDRS